MKQKAIKEQAFLADPLQPPTFLPANREGHTKTIEEERKEDLESYRVNQLKTEVKEEPLKEEPLKLVSEDKEEPLVKEETFVKHDVAVSEAEAGKIQLPKTIPIKTFRLDVEKFNAFFAKKFYRVKLDYDLYLEVNADHPEACIERVLEFAEAMLKGMLPIDIDNVEIEEFMPRFRNEADQSDFDLS